MIQRALTAFAFALLVAVAPASAQHTVTRVVDGDTFELSNGREVRLVGVDTPEKHMSSKLRSDAERTGQDVETIQALGRAATQEAKRLAGGKRVELEFDQNNAPDHEGGYGRTLAYVWVLSGGGERTYMVNRRLVAGGYAHAYLKFPSERGEAFARLERKARKQGAGLWSEGMVASSSAEEEAGQQSGASASLPYDPSGPDRDCGDFSSQTSAQAFFNTAGPGDPHRLDNDSDGQACESL